MQSRKWLRGWLGRIVLVGLAAIWMVDATALVVAEAPYEVEGQSKIAQLHSKNPAVRARAAEALGYMRYYSAEGALLALLADPVPEVRRNAALSLGWCGGRSALTPLAETLHDDDWQVRQSAYVALTNLAGVMLPFDAQAETEQREAQASAWKTWIADLPEDRLPEEVVQLLSAEAHHDVERGARAAGVLGGAEAVAGIIASIQPWRDIENETEAEAKWRVQAGIRALGRSGAPEALPVLKAFLNNGQWARYAADALGDYGGEAAATALLEAYPRYARSPEFVFTQIYTAPNTPPTDQAGFDSRDRILATPYAITFSLSRIPFAHPENLELLRRLAPLLMAQIPMDLDGLVVYEEEPHQRIIRHLLDKAGKTDSLLEEVFDALNLPHSAGKASRESMEEASIAYRSPVLRGGDAPHKIAVDVSGWEDLFLILDDVENYSMDRANWAEARLIDAAGEVTYLDEIEPTYVYQQHDSLRTNQSANFEDLRIGDWRFERGLHTHARSVIHFELAGRYERFEAWGGVCASRSADQGSVQFQVSQTQPAQVVDYAANPAYAANLITALCREPNDVPRLIPLLDHPNHWVRINAAKTLSFIGAPEAVEAIGTRLRESKPEAEFGEFHAPYFSEAQGQDEFNDPAPRYREAFIIALGQLGATEYAPYLEKLMNDERNALGIQHAAARALDTLDTPGARDALKEAEVAHPYHSVRMVAREALWKREMEPWPRPEAAPIQPPEVDTAKIPGHPTRFVFIQGEHVPYNPFQMDSWRQAYMTTDSGPTYRPGRNLYVLDLSGNDPVVTPLTTFSDGYVADCEVSYEGGRVLFSRRTEDSPWWHLYEIRTDGTALRQLTDGPYHDVQPTELPSGRIAFSTTRLGARDEYHGYLATGLATMHPEGSDIQVIGFNVGRDAEPAVSEDGSLIFSRLELFYSRMKTEFNVLRTFPDGTHMETVYGPERRAFWTGIHGGYANWTTSGDRHRQLRLVQPRPYRPGNYLLTTPAGPVITQGRHGERLLREAYLRPGGNDPWVITTPHKLDENSLLVAAGKKQHEMVEAEFPEDAVDLGLYRLDVETGEMTLLYNDPEVADFEARPLHPRKAPPVLPESAASRGSNYTGTLYANSVFTTQEAHVPTRGRLLRVIEGQPQVARHMTHTSGEGEAWKNHGGTFARVLATVPLANDGSFAVEAPADRLLHLQVLDSDRNVVGNQTNWMHLRPGETKGCVGCHEPPETAALAESGSHYGDTAPFLSIFEQGPPPSAVPDGEAQFRYRAKMWFKGEAPDEREERQRTVQAINWFGRP